MSPDVVVVVPGWADTSANNVGTICDNSTSCSIEEDPDVASDVNSKGVPSRRKEVVCCTAC